MEEKLNIWFDKEGDYLEITLGEPRKGYFKPIGNEDVWERIDEETGKVIGFALLNFTKMFDKPHEKQIKLPLKIELKEISET